MTARADDLAGRCEGARTPGLVDAAAVVPLTRREREVATLAAAGLSNQDIADRLYVSVRTVETHLANSYVKLGVVGRGELASVISPIGGSTDISGRPRRRRPPSSPPR